MRGAQRQSKRANCLRAKKLGPHGEGFTQGIRLAEPGGGKGALPARGSSEGKPAGSGCARRAVETAAP